MTFMEDALVRAGEHAEHALATLDMLPCEDEEVGVVGTDQAMLVLLRWLVSATAAQAHATLAHVYVASAALAQSRET